MQETIAAGDESNTVVDAQSYFSAKLVVRQTRCDQFEASPDGTGDSGVRGFSSPFEKLFRDFYSDFSSLWHGPIIVTRAPS